MSFTRCSLEGGAVGLLWDTGASNLLFKVYTMLRSSVAS